MSRRYFAAIVDDLFFSSKITATAAAVRATGVTVRHVEELVAQLARPSGSTGSTPDIGGDGRGQRPSLILLDLHLEGRDALGEIAALQAHADLASVPTVGFIAHVQTDRRRAAIDAGLAVVWPRSRLAEHLAGLLVEYADGVWPAGVTPRRAPALAPAER